MYSIKNTFSLILFFIFFISYIMKLVILYKRDNIKANVLAKGKKASSIKFTELFVKSTTFIWGLAWLSLSLFEPVLLRFAGTIPSNLLISLAGLLITFSGVSVFMTAMISMRTSWRVGIDKTSRTKLVTYGIYHYSRNPAFVGFNLMFLGVFLLYPSLLTLIIFGLNSLAIHLLILQEEKHLRTLFGDEYTAYCRKTPRYILFLHR